MRYIRVIPLFLAVMLGCGSSPPGHAALPPEAERNDPAESAREPEPQSPHPVDESEEQGVQVTMIRRVTRVRSAPGEAATINSNIVEWLGPDAVRLDKDPLGIVPAITILWIGSGARPSHISDRHRYSCPWFGFTDGRGHIAQELRIARTQEGGLDVPSSFFDEVAYPFPHPEPGALEGTSVYRLRGVSGHTVHMWVAEDTALTGADFAAHLRRRLRPPYSSAEESLLRAFEALPGFPVQFRDESASGSAVTRAVQVIESRTIPASQLEVPSTYRRVDRCTRALADGYFRDYEARVDEGRRNYGLDEPFEATPAYPIPENLPGGSCSPQPGVCVEAWNGAETNLSNHCDPPFNFHEGCPREELRGVCEAPERDALTYFYRNGPRELCSAPQRWFPFPD